MRLKHVQAGKDLLGKHDSAATCQFSHLRKTKGVLAAGTEIVTSGFTHTHMLKFLQKVLVKEITNRKCFKAVMIISGSGARINIARAGDISVA